MLVRPARIAPSCCGAAADPPSSLPMAPGSKLRFGLTALILAGAVMWTLSPPAASGPVFGTAGTSTVEKPRVVWKPIPYGKKRKREMAAYSKRHYGRWRWRLRGPKVVVEHFTGSDCFSCAWNTFASNAPNLGELPGTCAHFIVARSGRIYQLVGLGTRCRHTVGLNYTAFGIEDVGRSDAEILRNTVQLRASLRLTLWLMAHFGIQLRNVIGHNESLMSPYHVELYRSWRCLTHGDWNHADMRRYRRMLRRMAEANGVPIGPWPPHWVDPNC
jgi:beta-N-acetylhexosaminidase